MHEPSIRVVRRDELSDDTPQTSGLRREVAFDSRNPDAKILSAFLTTVLPGAATGAHHHGDQETILYVVEGTARYRWGDRLQHVVEAGPGDFIFIPAHTVHQEINASGLSPGRTPIRSWSTSRSWTSSRSLLRGNTPIRDTATRQQARRHGSCWGWVDGESLGNKAVRPSWIPRSIPSLRAELPGGAVSRQLQLRPPNGFGELPIGVGSALAGAAPPT
jgi:uncharacterized RmlC-like cupin family protein